MRSRQAFKNMMANIILQMIVFVSGIILPRFYLEAYGSSVNGMITSVSQFLMYLGLAEAGVGTASLVALYGPLSNSEDTKVNSILSATRIFYNRSGVLFLALMAGLTAIYPLLIAGQLRASTVRMIVIVLGSSTLIDYFFVGKYKVFLTANQRGYIIVAIQGGGTVLNTIITIMLIKMGGSIVFVKLIATMVYVLRFFLTRYYVKKHYPGLNFKASPDFAALNQKGAALLHQVVGIIVNNTDVVVLTICLGKNSLLEVSVYGIYNMVIYAMNLLLTSFSNGLTAGFGEVMSQGEQRIMERGYSSYEYVYFIILFIVISCMWGLLVPFVSIYTKGMEDVNYIRPVAAVLFTLIVFLQNVRIPSITIISAAGHFRETQRQAITEAVINITISLLLVWKIGMVGVLFGTVCSYGFRSLEIIVYNHRHLVKGTGKRTMKRLLRNTMVGVILFVVEHAFIPIKMESFAIWIVYAVVWGIISMIAFCGVNYFFERDEYRQICNKMNEIIKK